MKIGKTTIIGVTLCMMTATACPVMSQETPSEPPTAEYLEVSEQGDQIDVKAALVTDAETTTAQASEIKRKAIQAEKARNAAENDKYGGAITIIAMGIVLSALLILSVLFLIFGKISSAFQKAQKRKAHGVDESTAEEHHEELDSGEVIAAISMALAEHMGQGHDMEDTILTIRRMRKAYSPWNSKIYNLRVTPEQPVARVSPLKK